MAAGLGCWLLDSTPGWGAPAGGRAAVPRAAIWSADVPGGDAALARGVADCVTAAGYQVEWLESAALTNIARLDPQRLDLLALPDARILPIESLGAVKSFLENGGDLLAIGLTAWETPTFRLGGRWMSREQYAAVLAETEPNRLLIEMRGAELGRWVRHSNRPRSVAHRELVREAGRAVLHVQVDALDGWDTLEPPPPFVFGPGDTLTCFRARGNAVTKHLAVEWIEQDGSRWIATVDLGPEWRNYALPPESFRPWQPPAGRGRAGDRLNVEQVARFTVGLAHSHTAVGQGKLEYWLGDVGAGSSPFGEGSPPPTPEVPRLESLAPYYQGYPIATAAMVQRSAEAGPIEEASPPAAVSWPRATPLLGLHPRPAGAGFAQERPWRWQPLLTAYDAEGYAAWQAASSPDASAELERRWHRGAVGALVVHGQLPFKGGVWALFTPATVGFYRQAEPQATVVGVLRQMRRGVFLLEGGSEFHTLFEDQPVRLGCRVLNAGRERASDLRAHVEVRSPRGGMLFEHEWEVDLAPGAAASFETVWPAAQLWPEARCSVTASLRAARTSESAVQSDRPGLGGPVLDRLTQELHRWRPRAEREFMAVRDGGFWLGDTRWKAHGVNYLPSSGIGVSGSYFEYWLGRGAYDPGVIQRDLDRVVELGFNAVSVFIYHRDLGALHLLDFLRRCERLGLKVNLSLRPGTPMDFRWSEMKALIEQYRLAQNDTVIAYDLAWEPSHYDHAYQHRHYTEGWRQWVRKRYGSIQAAEQAWGVPAPKSEIQNPKSEVLAVPTAAQLTRDGPWRKLVADYRLFLDELVGERYAEARRLVRSIDPHHPVSFRMQHAGDPTLNWDRLMPYDCWGLRDAVDLWEPEAYGRIGDWDKVKAGHFTAAYARLCDPAKPVLWAEMGYNVWDLTARAPSAAKLDFAARYYRDFYRMLIESGADGVFFWWYPGGFRVNENSDYGVVNPDGTARSVTQAIRAEGPRFLAAPKPPPPSQWIAVDRDRDARGLFGIYEAVQEEYWRRIESGKRVGLKWSRQPGGQ